MNTSGWGCLIHHLQIQDHRLKESSAYNIVLIGLSHEKIGIVRGLMPESTLYYYRTLIDLCRKSEDLRGNCSEIIIYSLRERLSKFGLKVAEEKSRIIAFGRYPYYSARKEGRRLATFDFLGFTPYSTRTRRGYFKVGRKTSKAKFRQRIKETNRWLKDVRNMVKLNEW